MALAHDLPSAAQQIGMSIWTLRRWICSGRLHPTRLSPNKLLTEHEELERLLREGREHKTETASTPNAAQNA